MNSPLGPCRVTLLTFAVGFTALCPVLCRAQDQPDAKRTVVNRIMPVYPEIAQKMQLRGTVKLEVTGAPNGKVKTAQVLGGSPLLARSAMDAVEKWKWVPAAQDTREIVELNFHPQ